MAAVSRKHDGFAPFGHQRSRLPLECDMADHFALAVSGHHRNELAALDLVPVAVRRENLRVHVVMAIDFEEAARDCRRIGFLRQIDDIVARCRRRGRRGRRGQRRLDRRGVGLGAPGQATVKADLPSVDSVRAAGDAGVAADAAGERRRSIRESRMAVQQDPGLDVSVRAHDMSAMRARSRDDPCAQSASQAWAVSSAMRLATDAGTPSASDASRTKARTSSPRAGSSTSCSSENRATEGAFTRIWEG